VLGKVVQDELDGAGGRLEADHARKEKGEWWIVLLTQDSSTAHKKHKI
jgi:hypothetical protein